MTFISIFDVFDKMVSAMYNVGRRMAPELRETAMGGCAVTPAGRGASC